MGIADLLSRLKNLKQLAPGRFVACCPAHEDRSPSLTVRELPDGRILLHCFAGCDTQAVLDAVGLTFGDLFPEPLTRGSLPRVYRAFSAEEVLACLSSESQIVAICAAQLADRKPLDTDDQARLDIAVGRLATALEIAHGR